MDDEARQYYQYAVLPGEHKTLFSFELGTDVPAARHLILTGRSSNADTNSSRSPSGGEIESIVPRTRPRPDRLLSDPEQGAASSRLLDEEDHPSGGRNSTSSGGGAGAKNEQGGRRRSSPGKAMLPSSGGRFSLPSTESEGRPMVVARERIKSSTPTSTSSKETVSSSPKRQRALLVSAVGTTSKTSASPADSPDSDRGKGSGGGQEGFERTDDEALFSPRTKQAVADDVLRGSSSPGPERNTQRRTMLGINDGREEIIKRRLLEKKSSEEIIGRAASDSSKTSKTEVLDESDAGGPSKTVAPCETPDGTSPTGARPAPGVLDPSKQAKFVSAHGSTASLEEHEAVTDEVLDIADIADYEEAAKRQSSFVSTETEGTTSVGDPSEVGTTTRRSHGSQGSMASFASAVSATSDFDDTSSAGGAVTAAGSLGRELAYPHQTGFRPVSPPPCTVHVTVSTPPMHSPCHHVACQICGVMSDAQKCRMSDLRSVLSDAQS